MKEKSIGKRGIATNSILLSFVQCLTMVTSILQTMILSRELSEVEYGTYSQGLLVVNFMVPFLLLGLANAITYFSGQKDIDVHKYVNTIVSTVFLLGVLGVVGIFIFRDAIQNYFGNPDLISVLPIVAFLPLLLNLISVYQTLFVAENMATSIAIRNAIVAVVQIGIVAISVYLLHDIHVIFLLLVLMDIVQIIIFGKIFKRRKYTVRIQLIERDIERQIFKYSIPLAFSTAIGTLSRYMDKLLIGNLMDVKDFALYANMAKELPFSFVVNSFTTVIMPAFIRMHADGYNDKLRKYWGKYLELGLCITWILCGASIFCADDLLIFLYSDKYARGIAIFIVYLIIELCRFSYFGMILSTYGKTQIIMYSSLFSLALNFFLNILLFHLLGMIGPAIASLISIFLIQMLQLKFSCKLLDCTWGEIFDIRFIILLIIEIIVVGCTIRYIGAFLFIHPIIRLIICGGCIVGILGLLNIKRINILLKDINTL